MRAAIYARVSTLDQEPENQLQELRRYIAADPLNLPVPRQGCQKLEEAGSSSLSFTRSVLCSTHRRRWLQCLQGAGRLTIKFFERCGFVAP